MTNATLIQPYRILFPMGVVCGLLGAALWVLHGMGWVTYPGVAHREWMMLGFEQAFVFGFLLTAMPAFTHGDPCRPAELALAVTSLAILGGGILWGHEPTVASAALAALVVLAVALGRRVAGGRARPPAEFVFVGLGVVAGGIGAALRLAHALGAVDGMPPRFADRLASMGMVLPLVLGLGSLLVPTFAGLRDPLMIPGIAGPNQSRGRHALYLPVVAVLATSFVVDLVAPGRWGHALRAMSAWVMILVVWRPWRPGRRDPTAWALRVAGPFTALGVTLAALMPAYDIAALHVTFIGGFALLTLAIGTRVIVSHGRRPPVFERAALGDSVLIALGTSLFARIVAETSTARPRWLVVSSIAWLAAWTLWGARVLPALVHRDGSPSRKETATE